MNKMKDSLGNELEVGDKAYFANYWTMEVVTITELMKNLNGYIVTLPNGNVASAHPEGLILKEKFEWPNKRHESHKSVRSSDASTFDFICDDCGATDSVSGGWGSLRKPCYAQKQSFLEAFEVATEDMKYDADSYIIWNGGDRPVDVDTIVAVKVRSGIPRSPVAAKHWPQITWRHRNVDDPMNQWDIVAYKVMK